MLSRCVQTLAIAIAAITAIAPSALGQAQQVAPLDRLVREPAFNEATPLVGRVRQVNVLGEVVRDYVSPQPNDLFGLAAVVLPDVDFDGVEDMAISAPNAFDAEINFRRSKVVVISGANGNTIGTLSGTPGELYGLGLRVKAPVGAEPA
jgi:hypothetical protein